ncbi:hypothetical protein KY306_00040 [Candidatus Woesearchaeota archaeon]|nr:hypothetical protein [Candidatus Woesearchaeota archaeon]
MVQKKIIEVLDLLEKDFELSEWTQKLDLKRAHNFLLGEIEELNSALEKNDLKNYSEELGDVLWLVLKLMKVAEQEGILEAKKVLEGIKEKINSRKPFLAEERFVSSEEELRIWNEIKKNESSGNHR